MGHQFKEITLIIYFSINLISLNSHNNHSQTVIYLISNYPQNVNTLHLKYLIEEEIITYCLLFVISLYLYSY